MWLVAALRNRAEIESTGQSTQSSPSTCSFCCKEPQRVAWCPVSTQWVCSGCCRHCCVLTEETPSSHLCTAEFNHLDLGWERRRCEEDHSLPSTQLNLVWAEGRYGSRPGGTQLLEFIKGPEDLKPPLLMELDVHYFVALNEVMSPGIIDGCWNS